MSLTKNDLLAISKLLDTKLETQLQIGLQPIKEDIQSLKNDVEGLKDNIRNIELHLENVTDKNIKILTENYMPAAKKYEKEVEQMETMRQDIDVLKNVVSKHSEKLQKIS